MTENKIKTEKISLFLHKENVESYEECLKKQAIRLSNKYDVKSNIGLPGKIFIHKSQEKIPKWKITLEKFTNSSIDIVGNYSNKAVVILKYSNRYFSLVYGYGKSMLMEETIERNFGLIVAANLIDPQKIKSINSMTLENNIIDIQRQANQFSNQSGFEIDVNRDILKSVAGSPNLESVASFLYGTDGLIASRKMNIENIKESIVFYYETYNKDDYKRKGFEWIDNVNKVKDKLIIDRLNMKLISEIIDNPNNIVIAPNRLLDFENLNGLFISGGGKVNKDSLILDYQAYLNHIKQKANINIVSKLKRDKIVAINISGEEYYVSNVYDGITFESIYKNEKYILYYGHWFKIDSNFYEKIKLKVLSIPVCNIKFKNWIKDISEGDYNKYIAESEDNYLLLDQCNFKIGGHNQSRVEPCDILTKDKQFIHVKRGGRSSQLSHLFNQGLVSAQLLSNDLSFKLHINEFAVAKFGTNFLNESDNNTEYEIVYAIAGDKEKSIVDLIPFFSLVTLTQTAEQLRAMQFKYSLMKIDYQ